MSTPPTHTLADLIAAALADACRDAQGADDQDTPAMLAALDRYAGLVSQLADARGLASAGAHDLIARLLRAGVDQRDLYGRPFSATVVRNVARDLGLEPPPPGPRPRIASRSATAPAGART